MESRAEQGRDYREQRGPVPVFFHEVQLAHRPRYEWQSGQRIHHPESSTRAEGILQALASRGPVYSVREPRVLDEHEVAKVHSESLLQVYRTASASSSRAAIYPSVFPVDHDHRSVNPANPNHTGAFCLDAGTPLHSSTWAAALWSAASAWDAADYVAVLSEGDVPPLAMSYALCRPPGHHATRDHFGGYCYLNNAALAARRLEALGPVALVDIDFHHGNGSQSIFYASDRVLFASIHGDPEVHYPYFWGYESEQGAGAGLGYNINVPLRVGVGVGAYLDALQTRILSRVRSFKPRFLVVSAGFDTAKGDPLGDFGLVAADFFVLGRLLGELKLPSVIVQEGGYDTSDLGTNVVSFLDGVLAGLSSPA